MSSGSDNVIELYDPETRDILDYCDQKLAELNGSEGCLVVDGDTPLFTEREFFMDLRRNKLRESAIKRRCQRV